MSQSIHLDDRDVGGPEALDSLVRRFWPGNRVDVHFDPQDPSFAVLEYHQSVPAWQSALGFCRCGVGLVAAALG